MRFVVFLLLAVFSSACYAQSEALAKNYFEQGAFDKAMPLYKELYEKTPHRNDYFVFYVNSLQQLEQLEQAEKLLLDRVSKTHFQKTLFIELGRNYLLQKNQSKADEYFQKAIATIDESPRTAYTIGNYFEKFSLLAWSIIAYEKGMSLDASLDYNSNLARIYGEQGQLDKMFNAYLDLVERNQNFLLTAQRNFSRYITDNPQNEANEVLRKALLLRTQNNPQLYYNHLLSWLFVQQKQYGRAFVQEKAIYHLTGEGIDQIIDISIMAANNEDYDTAKEMLNFIAENTSSEPVKLKANQYLLGIETETAETKNYPAIEKKYESLIASYEKDIETFDVQIDYCRFLAFNSNKKELAIEKLRTLNKKRLSRYQEAKVLMELADILVFDEKFNEALIYYSQIQNKVKNDPLAQEARYKVARTSFFKGDFAWAKTQLDVLKKSTSQLIANDALEMSLLISDNSYGDSTQTALKKYAKADLLKLQNKHREAITVLDEILQTHKGEAIEDEALLLQAKLYEETKQDEKAIANYLQIIEFHNDDILADNAYFYLAELYNKTLQQPEKAREFYEMIIFNHQDSIYFVEARKQYRSIRGDIVN